MRHSWTDKKTLIKAACGSGLAGLALAVLGACSGGSSPSQAGPVAEPPVQTETLAYVASSVSIPNPERGLYRWVDCNVPVTVGQLAAFASEDGTLLMCNVELGAFINAPISQTSLDAFQGYLDTVRDAGMKTILRFRYNGDGSTLDADLARVEQHIDQLQPYLENNQDVIALLQTGFIGGWGEWGYSDNFGSLPLSAFSEQNWTDRQRVVDKLLAALPTTRMVQLRTPAYKQRPYGSTPLAEAEAYNGSARARVGHHNDCFLTTFGDYGTYQDTSVDYPYLAADSRYVPVGGETCAYLPPRTSCENALEEMALFHWSYLNDYYHPDVIAAFQAEGCYTEIKKRLGYRFVLQDAVLPSTAKAGGQMSVTIRIRNDGFATPYNPRDVKLVLRNVTTGAETTLNLSSDPRFWTAGQTTMVTQTLTLPSAMAPGEYTMLISLPDPQPSLNTRPEYAIRLANEGVWEVGTGFNRLGHTVLIRS